MNTRTALHLGLLSSTLLLSPATLPAQGTAFTYQGRFTDSGAPYTGNAEFQATLWNAASAGTKVADNNPAQIVVGVTNGLFVLPLDFGANFPGADRWLQLEVRTAIGPFNLLSPRQQITATPYAVTAGNLTGPLPAGQLSGTIPSANLGGTYSGAVTFDNAANHFSGSGAGLISLNASQLTGGTLPEAVLGNAWRTTGNSGTAVETHFIGTTDAQPLEFKVNNERVLRLEFSTNFAGFSSPSPNVVSGFAANEAAAGVNGATIAGGGGTNWFGSTSPQRVGGDFSTIGGGIGNEVQGVVSAIAGGERGFIGSNAYNAFLGGGAWNSIHAPDSVIGGGRFNVIQPGAWNTAIGGGVNNTVQTNANHATIGGGDRNVISNGTIHAVIGGGTRNFVGANTSGVTIGGGGDNTNSGNIATISGGYRNKIDAGGNAPVIGGGVENVIGMNAHGALIGGGANNSIGAGFSYATIPGGHNNIANGSYSFAAGSQARANHQGAFVWADSVGGQFSSTAANQFSVRASGGLRLAGNVELETSTYRHLLLSGGNSRGYLYGSFPALGDGVHLAYNHFYNAAGSGQVINTGGATSRLTVGYGFVGLYIGGVTAAPTTQRLLANSAGVTVNGTFNNSSDRHTKQNFASVDPARILERVVQLPISQWSYREDPATRHIGPMAQDFHAAFQIGTDDKHIAPLDEGGVALAAIQGLNQKVESGKRNAESRLEKLEAENAELREALSELKALVLVIHGQPAAAQTGQ